MPRPIHEIARDVRRDWKKVYFGAEPYLEAMESLDSVADSYGADSAASIIRYFLANANGWRGPTAKAIKAELNSIKGRYGSVIEVAARHIEARVKAADRPDGSWSDWPRPDPSAPKTIWGPAQTMYVIDRGVRWFNTAGHGGLAIADGVARKMLTPAAYKLGDRQWGYLWYEEDVAYAIPFYEHPEWAETLARKAGVRLAPRSCSRGRSGATTPSTSRCWMKGFPIPASRRSATGRGSTRPCSSRMAARWLPGPRCSSPR